MDFPCTQKLCPSSDEEADGDDEKIYVGSLVIGDIQHGIFTGENRIGRDSTRCSVVIQNQAVSLEHACIAAECTGDVEIFDLGSSNKTRLGKKVLKPHTRYALEAGAEITFGNVSAVFSNIELAAETPRRPPPNRAALNVIPESPDSAEDSAGENDSKLVSLPPKPQDTVVLSTLLDGDEDIFEHLSMDETNLCGGRVIPAYRDCDTSPSLLVGPSDGLAAEDQPRDEVFPDFHDVPVQKITTAKPSGTSLLPAVHSGDETDPYSDINAVNEPNEPNLSGEMDIYDTPTQKFVSTKEKTKSLLPSVDSGDETDPDNEVVKAVNEPNLSVEMDIDDMPTKEKTKSVLPAVDSGDETDPENDLIKAVTAVNLSGDMDIYDMPTQKFVSTIEKPKSLWPSVDSDPDNYVFKAVTAVNSSSDLDFDNLPTQKFMTMKANDKSLMPSVDCGDETDPENEVAKAVNEPKSGEMDIYDMPTQKFVSTKEKPKSLLPAVDSGDDTDPDNEVVTVVNGPNLSGEMDIYDMPTQKFVSTKEKPKSLLPAVDSGDETDPDNEVVKAVNEPNLSGEMDIYDMPTQKFVSTKEKPKSLLPAVDSGDETDPDNEVVKAVNEPNLSGEMDIYDMPTQKFVSTKEKPNSLLPSADSIEDTDPNDGVVNAVTALNRSGDMDIHDLPTQKFMSTKSADTGDSDATDAEEQIEGNILTHRDITSTPKNGAGNLRSNFDDDFFNAETQKLVSKKKSFFAVSRDVADNIATPTTSGKRERFVSKRLSSPVKKKVRPPSDEDDDSIPGDFFSFVKETSNKRRGEKTGVHDADTQIRGNKTPGKSVAFSRQVDKEQDLHNAQTQVTGKDENPGRRKKNVSFSPEAIHDAETQVVERPNDAGKGELEICQEDEDFHNAETQLSKIGSTNRGGPSRRRSAEVDEKTIVGTEAEVLAPETQDLVGKRSYEVIVDSDATDASDVESPSRPPLPQSIRDLGNRPVDSLTPEDVFNDVTQPGLPGPNTSVDPEDEQDNATQPVSPGEFGKAGPNASAEPEGKRIDATQPRSETPVKIGATVLNSSPTMHRTKGSSPDRMELRASGVSTIASFSSALGEPAAPSANTSFQSALEAADSPNNSPSVSPIVSRKFPSNDSSPSIGKLSAILEKSETKHDSLPSADAVASSLETDVSFSRAETQPSEADLTAYNAKPTAAAAAADEEDVAEFSLRLTSTQAFLDDLEQVSSIADADSDADDERLADCGCSDPEGSPERRVRRKCVPYSPKASPGKKRRKRNVDGKTKAKTTDEESDGNAEGAEKGVAARRGRGRPSKPTKAKSKDGESSAMDGPARTRGGRRRAVSSDDEGDMVTIVEAMHELPNSSESRGGRVRRPRVPFSPAKSSRKQSRVPSGKQVDDGAARLAADVKPLAGATRLPRSADGAEEPVAETSGTRDATQTSALAKSSTVPRPAFLRVESSDEDTDGEIAAITGGQDLAPNVGPDGVVPRAATRSDVVSGVSSVLLAQTSPPNSQPSAQLSPRKTKPAAQTRSPRRAAKVTPAVLPPPSPLRAAEPGPEDSTRSNRSSPRKSAAGTVDNSLPSAEPREVELLVDAVPKKSTRASAKSTNTSDYLPRRTDALLSKPGTSAASNESSRPQKTDAQTKIFDKPAKTTKASCSSPRKTAPPLKPGSPLAADKSVRLRKPDAQTETETLDKPEKTTKASCSSPRKTAPPSKAGSPLVADKSLRLQKPDAQTETETLDMTEKTTKVLPRKTAPPLKPSSPLVADKSLRLRKPDPQTETENLDKPAKTTKALPQKTAPPSKPGTASATDKGSQPRKFETRTKIKTPDEPANSTRSAHGKDDAVSSAEQRVKDDGKTTAKAQRRGKAAAVADETPTTTTRATRQRKATWKVRESLSSADEAGTSLKKVFTKVARPGGKPRGETPTGLATSGDEASGAKGGTQTKDTTAWRGLRKGGSEQPGSQAAVATLPERLDSRQKQAATQTSSAAEPKDRSTLRRNRGESDSQSTAQTSASTSQSTAQTSASSSQSTAQSSTPAESPKKPGARGRKGRALDTVAPDSEPAVAKETSVPAAASQPGRGQESAKSGARASKRGKKTDGPPPDAKVSAAPTTTGRKRRGVPVGEESPNKKRKSGKAESDEPPPVATPLTAAARKRLQASSADRINDSIGAKRGRLNASVQLQDDESPRRVTRSGLSDDGPPRVLFTGFCDPQQLQILTRLGGTEAATADECSVLVTDRVRRTCKFLSCVGLGKPIVSPDWLCRCDREKAFLDPWDFTLSDPAKETEFGFRLVDSLKAARAHKLLEGYTVLATQSVKPPTHEMKGIVESCGGRFVTRAAKHWPKLSFVVTCTEDKATWPRYKAASHLVTAEFLLIGALRQVLDFAANKITS